MTKPDVEFTINTQASTQGTDREFRIFRCHDGAFGQKLTLKRSTDFLNSLQELHALFNPPREQIWIALR